MCQRHFCLKMPGGFQKPQHQRIRRTRAAGYLRSPYQRGGTIIGGMQGVSYQNPSRLSPWFVQTVNRQRRRRKQKGGTMVQRGGTRYRRKPTLTDKIAEGVAMGLSGPSPSFLKLGAFLGKQSVKGIRDNVQHYRSRR